MSSKVSVIKLRNIDKIYEIGGIKVNACKGIDLDIYKGEFVVIMGPSGSGKSTLMNIIGCLDRPDSGSYMLAGNEVSDLDDNDLAKIRNRQIGFVFQDFHLLPGTTARENVELPMIYAGIGTKERVAISKKSLSKVSLEDRADHMPDELSGGQQQRVAIARALTNRPSILLADEPTGNLDSVSGDDIMALFQDLHRRGTTIILITHDPEMVKYGTRVVKLHDGNVVSDEKVRPEDRILSDSDMAETTGTLPYMKGRIKTLQNFRVAWKALRANKVRSLLTLIGIIIGVASLIVMTSIGEGTRYEIMQRIYSMGSNLIFLRAGDGGGVLKSRIGSQKRFITMKDMEFVKEKCKLIKNLAPEIRDSVIARYYSNNLSTRLIGSTADYLEVRNFTIEKGRVFSDEEMKSRAAVCILGPFVAESLFGKEEPVGKTIKISKDSSGENGTETTGERLVVIGVTKRKGDSFDSYQDDMILVPLNTFKYKIFYKKYISMIYLEAVSFDDIDDAIEEVKWAVMPLHGNNPRNISIRSQGDFVKEIESTLEAFTFLLGGIAFISLLVGGIGIMNIMLVSVTERTREIGLRKALGAREKDILSQFLVEALVLGITGGVIGIFVGIGLARVYTMVASAGALEFLSHTLISVHSVIISFSFAAAVGVFFGLYPARKAARLDPIEALRYE